MVLRYKSYQSSELLPGFTDVTEIGTGDYATVYAAKESDSGRSVALKMLNVREISPRALQSLLRETSVLETLSAHPNIVTLRRTDVTPDGRPVLVMDLCRGPVAGAGPGGRLDPAQAVAVAIKIAGALETAHRAGMVHGCVTPHKLLMTYDGEPALADLGAAGLRTFSDTAGQVEFATLHMAPEMLEGTTATTATDIYELAASLYSLVAGQAAFRTFDGEASAAVIMRILRDPVPPLMDDAVPLALSDLLVESMAKNPLKRPSSALEFADRLKGIEGAQSWPSTSYFVVDGAAYRFLEPMPAGDDESGDLDRAFGAEPLQPTVDPVPPSGAGSAGEAAGAPGAEGDDATSLWRALTEQPRPRRGDVARSAGGWMRPTPAVTPVPVARHAPAPVLAPNTTAARRVVAPTPRRTVATRTVATPASAITTNPNTGRHIVRPDPLVQLLAGAEEAPGDPATPELRPRFRQPGPRPPRSRAERYPLADGMAGVGITAAAAGADDGLGDDLSGQEVEEAIRRAGRTAPMHPDP